jgi:hypothetical protein
MMEYFLSRPSQIFLIYSIKDKRAYIKKIQSLHTTPTDPPMDEDHVKALYSENNEIHPSTMNQKYRIPRDVL